MSKKKVESYCLVIDACLAEAAGSSDHPPPAGARCRDFLMAVLGASHRVAWSESLASEWDKHMRHFAAQWLRTMTKMNKLRPVTDERLHDLREAIEEHSEDRAVVEKMIKDAHLFEAALATDMRIASWDENARGHFGRLAESFARIRSILWVDPVIEGRKAVEWLRKGAPATRARRLDR
jgi:hypothetical protein